MADEFCIALCNDSFAEHLEPVRDLNDLRFGGPEDMYEDPLKRDPVAQLFLRACPAPARTVQALASPLQT